LLYDTQEASPSVEDFLPFGLMVAYHALMSRSPGRPSGNYAEKYADARELAMKSRYWDWTSDRPEAAAATEGVA
jgi:hypothetical protein